MISSPDVLKILVFGSWNVRNLIIGSPVDPMYSSVKAQVLQPLQCVDLSWSREIILNVWTTPTVLMNRSTVIDHLEKRFEHENIAIAYIYFDYNDRDNLNNRNITASLLQQLATRLDKLEPTLEKTYDDLYPRCRRPEASTLKQLLLCCAKDFHSSYIIFDALDECGEAERPEILSTISQLSRVSQIFATSRHHPRNVQRLFEGSPTIEISASQSDIRNFLEARLKEEDKLSPELKDMIMAKLLVNAQGMYSPFLMLIQVLAG